MYSTVDIAATGQKLVEDYALIIVKNILKKTKKNNIVCSGGFFQNISFNKRLLDMGLKGVYVPSAPNDAGLSLGAALFTKMTIQKNRPKKIISPYLGPNFKSDEIELLLNDYKLKFKKSKNTCLDTAKLLSEGKIVGWFQGRSELGPRSLGARSVLADPRRLQNKAKINQLLKKRDWFMPYAPSILSDQMGIFFKKFNKSPYMSFALDVVNNHDKIRAAVHVDGTSRPQAVFKELNFKFYNLIKHFYKITAVPAVLNTSFNRHGIATIVTPRNAIDHLLNGCVDILVIEDFIVYKNKNSNKKKLKLIDEKKYIFIEKLLHVINLINNKELNILKKMIIEDNFFLKNKITFNSKTKKIFVGNKKINCINIDREKLWKILLK